MLIIVEGCDKVGKSTIIDEIMDLLPNSAQTWHRGPLKRHPLVEYEAALINYRPGTDDHIVCDRWHVGETIYGPLLRGKSELTPAMKRHVEMFLQSRGALRVVLDAPWSAVSTRLNGTDPIGMDDAARVLTAYRDYADAEHWSVPGQSVAYSAQWYVSLAKIYEANGIELSQFRSYVGGRTPDVLLLGHQRHPKTKSDRPDYPSAFVPYRDTSGDFLLNALEADGRLKNYGLANAGEDNIRHLWETLDRPRIVALGKESQALCNAAGLHHQAVPHPQYIRRFENATSEYYADMIVRRAGVPCHSSTT